MFDEVNLQGPIFRELQINVVTSLFISLLALQKTF